MILFSPNTLAPIHQVNAAGGGPATPVTEIDPVQGETTHRWAHFLPDGRHFLYMAASHTLGTRDQANAIYLQELGNDERRLLFHARSNVVYSDGHLLYVRDGVLVAQPFDPASGELSGDPFSIADRLEYASGFFRGLFSASANGDLLVYQPGTGTDDWSLAWLDRSGEKLAILRESSRFATPALDPTGRRAAVAVTDPSTGSSDIYVYDLERDVETRLSFLQLSEFSPIWSPDGRRVAFSSATDSTSGLDVDLYVQEVGGRGDAALLEGAANPVYTTADGWSPDGRHLVYSTYDSTNNGDLWVVPLDGEAATSVFGRPFNDSNGFFSPDGRWLGYISDESGRQEVYATSFPDLSGRWQISTTGVLVPGAGFAAKWLDGEVLFRSNTGEFVSVPVEDEGDSLRIGAPEVLFEDPRLGSWDVTQDGERLLVLLAPRAERSEPLTVVRNWTVDLGR